MKNRNTNRLINSISSSILNISRTQAIIKTAVTNIRAANVSFILAINSSRNFIKKIITTAIAHANDTFDINSIPDGIINCFKIKQQFQLREGEDNFFIPDSVENKKIY